MGLKGKQIFHSDAFLYHSAMFARRYTKSRNHCQMNCLFRR